MARNGSGDGADGNASAGTRTVVVRRVNRRLILTLAAAAAVTGAGIHGLHAFMVDRNAGAIRERAEQAEQEGKPRDAIALLAQYRQFRPDDLDAAERLAALLAAESDSPAAWRQAFNTLEEVLRKDPARHHARRSLADAAMKLGRFKAAEHHIAALSESDPAAVAELTTMMARAQHGLGEPKRAALFYARAIAFAPADVPAYAEFAELLASDAESLPLRDEASKILAMPKSASMTDVLDEARRPVPLKEEDRKKTAREIPKEQAWVAQLLPLTYKEETAVTVAGRLADEMVSRGRPEWKAFLTRAEYRQTHDDPVGAAGDIGQALTSPDARKSDEALWAAATIEMALADRARLDEDKAGAERHRTAGKTYVEQGLKAEPPEPRFYLLLSQFDLSASPGPTGIEAAIAQLRQGLARTETLLKEAGASKSDPSRLVRLSETQVLLRWTLADLLIAAGTTADGTAEKNGKQDVVRTEIRLLQEEGCRPDLIEFLDCRLAVRNHDWTGAASRLERLRLRLAATPDLVRKTDLMLGECYARLQNPDRRIEVFRRAKAADPLWVAGRIGLAEALAGAGRIDEALTEYAGVGREPGVAEAAARLVMLRELRKPAGERNLDAIESAVKVVEDVKAGSPAAAVLRAELLVVQEKYAEAEEVLAKASEAPAASDDRDIWQARVGVALKPEQRSAEDRAATASELVADAEKRFGDVVEVRLAKAQIARLQGADRLRDALSRMSEKADQFSATDRFRLYEGLLAYAGADADASRRLWAKIVELRPDYLPGWLAIAQAAVDSGDETAIRRALDAIRRVEGPDGPNGDYVQAFAEIRAAARNERLLKNPKELEQALAGPRGRLQRAGERRSYWAAVPRALGAIETLLGNRDAAFQHFMRARQLGDHSTQVVRAVVDYYRSKKQFDRADAAIREAEQEDPGLMTGEMARLAWRVAMDRGQVDTALALTGRLAAESKDFRDRIVHAHILFVRYRALPDEDKKSETGQKLLAEARDLYRKVVEEAPDQPEAWLAYVVHLSRVRELDAARAVVAEAEQKLPAEPAYVRLVCLAQCYDVTENAAQAADAYRRAVAAAPDKPELRIAAADYFSRSGDVAEANRHLEWLLDGTHPVSSQAAAWARQRRAFTTAARGRYEDVQRALALLHRDAADGQVPVEDLRAELALLNGRVSLRDRRQVRQILEEIRSRDTLTDPEKLRLAGLYEATGDWPKGKALFQELAAANPANATILSATILGTLRHESPDAAAMEKLRADLDRLRTVAPTALRTASTSAEFEARGGNADAATAVLREYVAGLSGAASRGGAEITAEERAEVRSLAERAEQLKLGPAAEELFKKFADASPQPEDAFFLAQYLGRAGRYKEGLAIVSERAERAAPEATAVAAVTIVSLGSPAAEELAEAERLASAALEKQPKSIRTLNVIGGLQMALGKYDSAEATYRQVLAEEPTNLSSLNNLGWLLVVTGKNLPEAERLVNEAVAIAGPLADLIDTLGMIHLAAGRPADAIRELQDAFDDTPTPSMGFHLALAYEQLGEREKSRKAFEEARNIGLSLDRLHSTEHKAYKDLALRYSADLRN